MKKIYLALLFALSSVVAFSQRVYDIQTVSYIVWENNKWTVKESNNPKEMSITAYTDLLIVDDRNKTIYRTEGEPEKAQYSTHRVSQWKAYDNDGKQCLLMIKYTYIPESTVILALYNGPVMYGFEYVLKN